MSTPKPPNGQAGGLTFFIDRDLGRHAFPEGLRRAGLVVVTMAEHYGVPHDQDMLDHEWMVEAARHHWPVLGLSALDGPSGQRRKSVGVDVMAVRIRGG
ncbi:MAG: hypothetical protein ACRDTT_00990 [Pseudonocardiaceae bacterium]